MRRRFVLAASAMLLISLSFTFPVTAVLFFNIIAPSINSFLESLTTNSVNSLSEIGVLWLSMGFGWILFFTRKFLRWFYGAAEVFFSVYGAGIALLLLYKPDSLPENFQSLRNSGAYPLYVGFVSAVCVVVRGLDNMDSWVVKK